MDRAREGRRAAFRKTEPETGRVNMKIKCNWCGSWINDFEQTCPNCGAVNENFRRQGTGVPQTIAELKEWAEKHHLPLGQMRTYIGVNYTGPKAFGIYRDENTGNFVVYKNKADGTRAVRYEGPDEAYAVNELYQKMKERVADQKSRRRPEMSGTTNGPVYLNTGNPVGYENRRGTERRRPGGKSFTGKIVAGFIVLQIVVFLLSVFIAISDRSPDTGYYQCAVLSLQRLWRDRFYGFRLLCGAVFLRRRLGLRFRLGQ